MEVFRGRNLRFKRKSEIPTRGYVGKPLPTKTQAKKLLAWMGSCRFLYNAGLEHRITCYGLLNKKSINYTDQQNSIPEIKKDSNFLWLKDVPSQALQASLQNLDKAYARFFRTKNGFPKFKRKSGKNTITFPQGVEIVSVEGKYAKVSVPKLGIMNCVLHRKIKGKIKSATISYSLGAGFSISFCVEQNLIAMTKPQGVALGIDLGIVKTVATSEEMDFHMPVTSLKKLEKRISIALRKRAKTVRFSERWKYFNQIIAKLHVRITRIRKDFLHKVSYYLSNNHGIIVMEDLKIKNMSKSASGTLEDPGTNVAQKSGLNRSILRQGWGALISMFGYKTKWYGSILILVNPKNTSCTCSVCFHVDKASRKSQEVFSCTKCGHTENADRNAAKVIKRLGLESVEYDIFLEAPTIPASAG